MITEDNNFYSDTEFEEIIENEENDLVNNIVDNNILTDETIEEITNANEAVIVDFEYEGDQDDFEDTLQLTEYVDSSSNNSMAVVAEYDNIDIIKVQKSTKKQATDLVNKITDFISKFNDIELNQEHKDYLKEVGKLELAGLQDILTLVQYNKLMIDNIIRRINAVQGDDFAMIQSYSSLVTQQMKLQKELHTRYKSIPMVMKKMRIEVMCNQELGEDQTKLNNLNEELNNLPALSTTKDKIRELRAKHEQANKENKN